MVPYEAGVPDDRLAHEGRVARGRGREHLAERLGEHDRLVLQDRIQQPEGTQGQLQPPPGVRRGPAGRGESAGVTRRVHAALGDGYLTHGGLSLSRV
jgi:hypothetical protein